MKLVLGSSSVYRKNLLSRLGFPFLTYKPDVDEDSWKEKKLSPLNLSKELAIAKAQDVLKHYPDCLILGSDQVAEVDGIILGKPLDEKNHEIQLKLLSGKTHSLWTAVALVTNTQVISWVQHTQLRMRALTDLEIKSYVQRREALDCAGGYKIESFGISLFDKIETDDPTAIEGLPLLTLAQELRKFEIN